MNNKIIRRFDIKISVPIIGDSSISKLKPPTGFQYKKIKLDEYEYRNKITDANNEPLEEYKSAIIEEDNGKYLMTFDLDETLEYDLSIPCNNLITRDYITFEKEFVLFKYFSLLHLIKEGDISWHYKFFLIDSTTPAGNNCELKDKGKINSSPADMTTYFSEPMKITDEDVIEFDELLSYDDRVYQMLKNVALDGFTFNYCIYDSTTNFKSLITILEVLFIEKSECKYKKSLLSKRISNFIGADDKEIEEIKNNISNLYELRNYVVHDGEEVPREKLNMLRDYTRRCIKKYMKCISKILKEHPEMKFDNVRKYIVKQIYNIIKNRKNEKNLKMFSVILDGCKNLDEAKEKVKQLIETEKKKSLLV